MRQRCPKHLAGYLAALLVAVVAITGCSTWRPVGRPVAAVLTEPKAPSRIRVLLRDGSSIKIDSPRIDADSLRGRRFGEQGDPGTRHSRQPQGPEVAVALADIAAVEREHTNPVKSALFVLAVGGLVAIFAFAVYWDDWNGL